MGIESINDEKNRWLKENRVNAPDLVSLCVNEEIEALYTPADIEETDYIEDIGFPGEYPFTRGIYPLMYRGKIWDMRQYSGLETAEDTNKRWKTLISEGQTSVSLACDLPTQLGYEADDPSFEEEMLKVGCHIDTLADMEALFDGIPLEKMACSFNVASQAPVFLAMFIAAAEKKGVPASKLSGTIANDILPEYLARGAWIYDVRPSMRLMADVVEYVCRNMPRFYPLNIRGILLGVGGRVISDHVGYTFSIAHSYFEEILSRGLTIDDFANRVSFLMCSGCHFFEYAALFRAARRLWAKLMKRRFGAKKAESMKFRFVTCPMMMEFTAAEPLLNLAREAYAVLGAALGGAQSMFSAGLDESYSIPTEKNALLALRVIQILAHETGVTDTVDPLAGSYYVESLTNQFEQKIIQKIGEIDGQGGAVAAIENGFILKELSEGYYKWQQEIESGMRTKIGVNKYPARTEEFQFYKVDPEGLGRQINRLRKVKAERDASEVSRALNTIREVARSNKNIMPSLIDAVKTYTTIAEITNVLKEELGVYREPVAVL
jgi:methylmalonyl-CoA mutase N-terminal domain/subunit